MKNRKTARLCRRKKKQETANMQETLKNLQDENNMLKAQLSEVKIRLRETENQKNWQQQYFTQQIAIL